MTIRNNRAEVGGLRRITRAVASVLACAVLSLSVTVSTSGPTSAAPARRDISVYSTEQANEVRRLYLAYFLREPDQGGATYWQAQRAAGVPLSTISAYFATSPEFRARYGTLDNLGFVRLVYRNVMEREPDAGGQTYWLDQLSKGMGRSALMLLFAQSPEFRSRTGTGPAPAAGPPAVPSRWPSSRVEVGLADQPGGAAALRASAPFAFRYQYLAGGVNTGEGWANWNTDGQFVSYYIDESRKAGVTPVFSYYMIYQSSPGRTQGEPAGVYTNLTNARTMDAYYRDLLLFFQRANQAGGTVVLHVEPDLWGYLQQRAGTNAAAAPVSVGSSGMPEVAGLADNAAGFAQAIVRLRNAHAPNVILGYHLSPWASGEDFLYSDPSDSRVQELGRQAAAFYRSLGVAFDIAFTDIADRDAGFREHQVGDRGASWMNGDDYRRSAAYIESFVGHAGVRAVLWQLPLGNTRMRAVNNTWGHFQDNKVEVLLDQPGRSTLGAYAQAGVVAFLFGGGAAGTTCACDAMGDGVTNPAPINGNTTPSFTADDDGGYFRHRVAEYYRQGATPLP